VGALMLGTIWLALAGLVAGEAGKTRYRRTGIEPRWAWPVSCAGLLACVVHILVAMTYRHGWSHQAAVLDTARQTAEVFGVAWGGGVYVNYLFVGLWLVDLLRWRTDPRRHRQQSQWARWALRTFYLVIVFNAAVVFAAPDRRLAGAAVTAAGGRVALVGP
jgi:hypothetical protein